MKLSNIDLRLFAAVAELGSISAAARKLGRTKSLVSRELIALEQRLGTRLVHRTTRRMSLTEPGLLLAAYAHRVVEELEAAEAAIEATLDSPRGDLNVTAPFSFLRFILAPRMAEFRARYPDIRLALDASVRVLDLVEEGVDVAIRIGVLPPSTLVARPIASVPIIFLASPHYLARHGAPAGPADLAAHSLLNLRRDLSPDAWSVVSAEGSEFPLTLHGTIAVHDPGLLLDLARQGLGIAPVPSIYARTDLESGTLARVLPGWQRAATPIHAVYTSRRILSPKVRTFIDFVAEITTQAAATPMQLGEQASR